MKNLSKHPVKIQETDSFREFSVHEFFESENCGIPYSALKSTRDVPRGWPDKLCWKRNSRILPYSGLIRGNDRSKTDQRGIMHGNSASIPCLPWLALRRLVSTRFTTSIHHLAATFDRLTFDPRMQSRLEGETREGGRDRGKGEEGERETGRESFAWRNDCFSARRIFIELSKLHRQHRDKFHFAPRQPRWRIRGIELAVNIRSLSGIFAPISTMCRTCVYIFYFFDD